MIRTMNARPKGARVTHPDDGNGFVVVTRPMDGRIGELAAPCTTIDVPASDTPTRIVIQACKHNSQAVKVGVLSPKACRVSRHDRMSEVLEDRSPRIGIRGLEEMAGGVTRETR